MVDKKQVVKDWPLETGDYAVGDPESCVAVVTLGSKMNDEIVEKGAAVAGPLHTENLGIEKVVANIVSNSNIRFLIICGSEVQGHITGQTVEALYENGIEEDTKSIIGSKGAIPFVENLTPESIERFQKQVELISMIDNQNMNEIGEQIKKCKEKDPGAYPEEALIISLNKKEEEQDDIHDHADDKAAQNTPINKTATDIISIENRIRSIHHEINRITGNEKTASGYYSGKIEGITLGFILTLIIIILIKYTH